MVAQPTAIDPDGLEAYFTDVEHLRDAFKALVAAPALPKRLLVIHGVGGVGKSSLLRMFRLHCKSIHAPMGLASGDEAKSAVDLLAAWADDLKADGVKLPTFAKTFAHYRGIQARVEEHARKSSGVMGKLAVKTAEGVAGSVAGAAIGSVIPIVGTLAGAAVGALVGTSGEALTDWLGGFLNRPDIDLLLDPVKRLTDDFLADLARAAPKRRLVLLLDTFEQLSALQDWARDLAQRLHPNVLLVIAGRAVPNWSRQWMGWLAQADVQELKPMTEEVMRALIERYYATMRGGSPDSAQVAAIVSFARGLPVVVTSAVRLWVEYGVEDFQAVKPQVMADLVDRLLEGVPRELVPMLEAAAAVRWFNKDLLRALLGQGDTPAAQLDAYSAYEAGLRDLLIRLNHQEAAHSDALIYQQRLAENIAQTRRYGDDNTRQAERAEIVAQLNVLASATVGTSFNELCDQVAPGAHSRISIVDINNLYEEVRHFPFTRPRAEGLSLHRAVRQIIDENLRISDPERHRILHERAANYYRSLQGQASSTDMDKLELEWLYHCVLANEVEGIRQFQDMAEGLRRHRLANRLRILLNDANSYALEHKTSRLWREYYNARLVHLEDRLKDAAVIYRTIGDNKEAEPKLRAYALCDLGNILSRTEWTGTPNDMQEALQVAQQSLQLQQLDDKLLNNYRTFAYVYTKQAKWEAARTGLEKMRSFAEASADPYNFATTCRLTRDMYFRRGDWHKGIEIQDLGLRTLPNNSLSGIRSQLLGIRQSGFVWAGLYKEAEQNTREAIDIRERLGSLDEGSLRDLALVLGMQRRFIEAESIFSRIVMDHAKRPTLYVSTLTAQGIVLLRQRRLQKAEECLRQALQIRQSRDDHFSFADTATWLGLLYETRGQWNDAEQHFKQTLQLQTGRCYVEASALTGLVHVKHAQADYATIPPLLAEAEQLAQQYEYNDHLASLRLTQGHVAWEGHIPEWGEGFDAALAYYQQALIYALRYNRFLLDEVLWGGGVGTPLRPIIPWCQERGEEGRRMLAALRDWWETGTNDLGAPRPDTISPIPEGIPLLEAERIARERELGDGTPQQTVLDRLLRHLSGTGEG